MDACYNNMCSLPAIMQAPFSMFRYIQLSLRPLVFPICEFEGILHVHITRNSSLG